MQEIDVTNSKLIRENIHETGKVKKSKRSSLRGQEHLANERTHQAWMRTAIALMGFGVIILRLRSAQISFVSHPGLGWKLGLFFCLVGWITVLISTRRYFLTRHNIDEDIYHPAHWSVIIFSAIVTLLGIGSIYVRIQVWKRGISEGIAKPQEWAEIASRKKAIAERA